MSRVRPGYAGFRSGLQTGQGETQSEHMDLTCFIGPYGVLFLKGIFHTCDLSVCFGVE